MSNIVDEINQLIEGIVNPGLFDMLYYFDEFEYNSTYCVLFDTPLIFGNIGGIALISISTVHKYIVTDLKGRR